MSDSKLSPTDIDAIDINWVAKEIGWPFGTWMDPLLYETEFNSGSEDAKAAQLIAMFNSLGTAIGKTFAAEATGSMVGASIDFKHWRKLSAKATKMKPIILSATMYKHPDYDTPWVLVS